MKTTLEVTIKPFVTPSHVDCDDTFLTLPLRVLNADTLDGLCDEFRRNVFEKAGKLIPPKCEADQQPRLDITTLHARSALKVIREHFENGNLNTPPSVTAAINYLQNYINNA